jgi:DNA-binding NarL/FixJ family response regulator
LPNQVFRVLVVEPDDVLRNVLLAFLDSCEDLAAAGSAVQAQEAIRLCQILKPDVLLIEFELPDLDGIETIRQLRQHCPFAPIVVLTGARWSERMVEAMEAGATGWLEKGMTSGQVVEALRLAASKTRKRET